MRAGLTPKLRDIPTLLSMLTYTYQPASDQIMPAIPYRGTKHTTLYDPPIDEFSVLLTTLGAEENEVHESVDGPSILIATSGSGSIDYLGGNIGIGEGEVYFVGAGTEVELAAGKDGIVVYRAFVEVN